MRYSRPKVGMIVRRLGLELSISHNYEVRSKGLVALAARCSKG